MNNKMKVFKKRFCKLCHNSISDLNFIEIDGVLREVLEVVLLKLNLNEERQHVMCGTCAEKMYAAFEFKSTCLYTDDAIFPYVDLENSVPIDLKEIYMSEIGINDAFAKEICRLCMKPIKGQFTSVHELDDKIFQKYIPEVNLRTTKDPVICKLCVDSIATHSSFLKNCWYVNTRTKHIFDEKVSDDIDVPNLEISSPTEEDIGGEIKSESEVSLSEIEETDNEEDSIKIEECEIKLQNTEGERFQSSQHLIVTPESRKAKKKREEIKINNVPVYKKALTGDSYSITTVFKGVEKITPKKIVKTNPQNSSNLPKHLPKSKKRIFIQSNTEKQLHECNLCDYKCKFKSRLTRHMLIHKDASELRWYECELCDHKFKTSSNFKQHMLVHKSASEIRWHQCELCDYKFKSKGNMQRHMLTHKNASEIQWYKCELCDYKSKVNNIKQHMLMHKEASEIQWYECNVCSHKSKLKGKLKRHMLIHKDASEVQLYECNICNFKSKYKTALSGHILVHKESSEIQWYDCDVCDYKSKRKRNLKNHMLKHKDSSEIQWYKCDICSYKSKQKCNLTTHTLIHKDPSEIRLFECNVCNFKTKYKKVLNEHIPVHKEASERQWYECYLCDYKCKHKYSLKKHILNHKDSSNIQWFKCHVCNFKSRYNSHITKHIVIHRDVSNV